MPMQQGGAKLGLQSVTSGSAHDGTENLAYIVLAESNVRASIRMMQQPAAPQAACAISKASEQPGE